MAETKEKRIRISNMLSVLMGTVAVGVDFVQGLLTTGFIGIVLNSFIGIFAWLMFWFWFKMQGVGFLDGKLILKSAVMWGAGLIEIVPIINNIPAWTVAIVAMLFIVRAEDMIYNKTGKSINMAKALKRAV